MSEDSGRGEKGRAVARAGNPDLVEFTPTKEQKSIVENMVIAGISRSMMAKIIGISRNTLKKAFKDELRTAMARANASVVGRLYKQTEKSTPAAIFWLCNRDKENWNNAHMMRHEGNESRPIFLKMTDDVRRSAN